MPSYPNPIKSKLPQVGTTIFSVMSKLAQEHGAINLSQGFPDFDCPPELVELVHQFMKQGHNQYAPMQGVMALREAIARKTQKRYSAVYHPDTEITITAGATQAIYTAITSVIKEGDEVIIFEPVYDCYAPAITLNGGITVNVKLKAPDYHIEWNEVKKLISQRTRMIIINTPHNPTGAILTAKDMAQLEKLTRDNDIIILSDEVYEHIIFDGYEHQSVARYPALAERSFIVYSFGKTYHTTGWKIGYCLAPENLMTEFRKVHQFQVFAANTAIQMAYAAFLENENHYNELPSFYNAKRDLFNSYLKESKFKLRPSNGSYFQLLDYSALSKQKDTDYALHLIKEHGVASVPVSVFYSRPVDKHVLRFCFAKKNDTIEQAAERLQKIKPTNG